MAREPITIDGLRQFARNLKKIDADLPKALRLAMNEAANLVVADARPKVPVRTGRAARSIRAASTRTQVRVKGGGTRAPYYPWLDFGGTVGRGKKAAVAVGRGHRRTADQQARAGSVKRPFYSDGRYIYKSYKELRDSGKFESVLADALINVARQAGVEVD